MTRSVVITGIGVISAAGSGRQGLWQGVLAGRSHVRAITRFDASPFRSQIAAEVDDFDPLDYLDAKSAKRMDRFAQFGAAAARQAVDDAGLSLASLNRGRIGVSLGSALGGVAYGEQQHGAFLDTGLRSVGPTLAIAVYGGAAGANIAIDLGIHGPNLAHATSCGAGTDALGAAMHLIERDHADVVLAGGVEVPLAPLTFGAFSVIKAMSTRNSDPSAACRPFDRDRDGFVMGEGAAILVLEEEGHALRRGAESYARLLAYGQTNDAYHMTAPRPDGREAARAMRLALGEARVTPSDIEYVNAHATGTPLGDNAESRAIESVFGENGDGPLVAGTKGAYGHALGASGAIETAITAMALHEGFLPGTINLDHPASDCCANVIGPEGAERRAGYALTASFGFGGANSALVLASMNT